MIVALTGTPGTGKTSISNLLSNKGFEIINLYQLAVDENLIEGVDDIRTSFIVNIKKLDDYIIKKFKTYDMVIIDGHLSHLLKNVDKVIVLRCHPKVLKIRLQKKNWNNKKICENLEAEILDIILCETVEIHSKDKIFEIDTTGSNIKEMASTIISLIDSDFKSLKKYNIGQIDWSEEILRYSCNDRD
jgi:adenylate kinase